MLTVYPGFIIMTSVPHKGSAGPTRGLEGKQTELPRSDIQFIMAKDKKLPKFERNMKMFVYPLLVITNYKVVFLFVGGVLESSHGKVSHHLFVGKL